MDRVDPMRKKLLTDIQLPNVAVSSMQIVEAKRAMPKTDRPEPSFT
jgi:hypothetical protein